ncbi:HAD hydrolase family IIID protein [Nitzschia inconspicua]|uniref:HAD hydrolase family IIID protein n=1 Tax=Nitzschia inconspicua TaxID=303405 RepID=A0A9K3PVU2_9STRA|nr:HAD hydrolase family IIID protein [Nitzschia inconspicua]
MMDSSVSDVYHETARSSMAAAPCVLVAKWGKTKIVLEDLSVQDTIATVKDRLTKETGVLQKRQKLIGLATVKGPKALNDDTILGDLKVKASKKNAAISEYDNNSIVHEFILMGTAEADIFVDPSDKDDLPDVVDDFDLDFNAGSSEWLNHVANGENLKKFTEHTQVHLINPPREGKPLMVLDLDHTLLDFSRKALEMDSTHQVGEGSAALMKRPYMDEFLMEAYKHYDLVVWSQTSWRWLETKLIELGMITHPAYKFCFVLDKTSMFTVKSTKRDGKSYVHHVKPLQLIWTKFPQWGSHNTVHLDDLSRNFALNVTSGLRVTPYHRKKSSSRRDSELLGLAKYLQQLAESKLNFDDVRFEFWQDVVAGKRSLSDKT